jgi:hypothetical protein
MKEFDTHAPSNRQPVWMILVLLFALCVAGQLAGQVLGYLLGTALGWSDAVREGRLAADAPLHEVWQLRVLLALGQVFGLLVPGALTLWLLRRGDPVTWRGAALTRWPGTMALGWGCLLLVVSVPLVLYSFQINKALPLPEALQAAYEQANQLTKALLQMPTGWDLLANLVLIAVIPAIGEELVFRGVLQQQLQRRMEPWMAILLTGAIFSAVHLQFDGFLPRWILGAVLGWAFWRSGNLWVSIAAHAFNNGVQVVGQYVYQGNAAGKSLADEDVQIAWWAGLLSLALMLAVGAIKSIDSIDSIKSD